MTIKAEFRAGDNIRAAFTEATRVALILSCRIEFNFNGVTCIAYPNGIPEKGVEEYQQEVKSKNKVKMAFS